MTPLPHPFTSDFLRRLEGLRIRARKEVIGGGPGNYASPRRGGGLEFAEYRRYAAGDDIRSIDWNLYARSRRLYVKLFREEVDLFAYIFIDGSASMGAPSPAAKFLPAASIALAVAYVALASHNHVKLHLLGGEPAASASPFHRGRHKMIDLARMVAELTPSGPLDLAPALGDHLRRVRKPGKALLISDFLMPAASYESGLHLLRSSNLDVSVIQTLSRDDVTPALPPGGVALSDSESGREIRLRWSEATGKSYRERLARHNRELRGFCHEVGIRYSLFVTDGDLRGFVLKTLPTVGLFR